MLLKQAFYVGLRQSETLVAKRIKRLFSEQMTSIVKLF